MSSDVHPTAETFENILEFVEKTPDAGLVGCKSILPNGKVEFTAKRKYTPCSLHRSYGILGLIPGLYDALNKHYHYILSGFPFQAATPVDVLQDSFLYIRGNLIREGLRFDENMRLYFTEDQLAKSVEAMGYRSYYLPHAQVSHQLEATTSKDRTLSKSIYRSDCIIFCRKYFGSTRALGLKLDLSLRVAAVAFLKAVMGRK